MRLIDNNRFLFDTQKYLLLDGFHKSSTLARNGSLISAYHLKEDEEHLANTSDLKLLKVLQSVQLKDAVEYCLGVNQSYDIPIGGDFCFLLRFKNIVSTICSSAPPKVTPTSTHKLPSDAVASLGCFRVAGAEYNQKMMTLVQDIFGFVPLQEKRFDGQSVVKLVNALTFLEEILQWDMKTLTELFGKEDITAHSDYITELREEGEITAEDFQAAATSETAVDVQAFLNAFLNDDDEGNDGSETLQDTEEEIVKKMDSHDPWYPKEEDSMWDLSIPDVPQTVIPTAKDPKESGMDIVDTKTEEGNPLLPEASSSNGPTRTIVGQTFPPPNSTPLDMPCWVPRSRRTNQPQKPLFDFDTLSSIYNNTASSNDRESFGSL